MKNYRGHYKEWWHFAYKCILEEDVRRRRRNWNWDHMIAHRQLCKDYASAYQIKLSCKGKVGKDQQCVLDEAEKSLDLFNLVVIRQRIEMEVSRLMYNNMEVFLYVYSLKNICSVSVVHT